MMICYILDFRFSPAFTHFAFFYYAMLKTCALKNSWLKAFTSKILNIKTIFIKPYLVRSTGISTSPLEFFLWKRNMLGPIAPGEGGEHELPENTPEDPDAFEDKLLTRGRLAMFMDVARSL